MNILLVEDDVTLAQSVAEAIRARGWHVDVSHRGEPVAKGVSPSMRSRRCNPDDLNWSSDQSRKDAMEVDFKKKHD